MPGNDSEKALRFNESVARGNRATNLCFFLPPAPELGVCFIAVSSSLGLFQDLRNNSSSLGMLAAMRLASSRGVAWASWRISANIPGDCSLDTGQL
jgi:hypothetical protein